MKRFVLPVIILVFLFCSCCQNTGSGVSTITDEPKTWVYLHDYEYECDWGGGYVETLTFSCPSSDVTSYTITYNGIPSQVLEYKMLDDGNGVNLLVKNTGHTNFDGNNQYPGYNEGKTPHECYSLMWLHPISENHIQQSNFSKVLGEKNEGPHGTACFKNEADAKEQLDTFFATRKTDFRR